MDCYKWGSPDESRQLNISRMLSNAGKLVYCTSLLILCSVLLQLVPYNPDVAEVRKANKHQKVVYSSIPGMSAADYQPVSVSL